jgi:hypothetical protein
LVFFSTPIRAILNAPSLDIYAAAACTKLA